MQYLGPLPFPVRTLGDVWDAERGNAQSGVIAAQAVAGREAAERELSETVAQLEQVNDQNYHAQVTIEGLIDLAREAETERKVTVLRRELSDLVARNEFEV